MLNSASTSEFEMKPINLIEKRQNITISASYSVDFGPAMVRGREIPAHLSWFLLVPPGKFWDSISI
jgi:hypothetical protein